MLQAIVLVENFVERLVPVSAERAEVLCILLNEHILLLAPQCLIPLVNIPLLNYTLEFLSANRVEHIWSVSFRCRAR